MKLFEISSEVFLRNSRLPKAREKFSQEEVVGLICASSTVRWTNVRGTRRKIKEA